MLCTNAQCQSGKVISRELMTQTRWSETLHRTVAETVYLIKQVSCPVCDGRGSLPDEGRMFQE